MFDDFETIEDEDTDFGFAGQSFDEPEGLAPPRQSHLCLGHETIEATLLSLINSGACPHAIIFNGPKGIGKSTMAFRLARYLLKNGTADNTQDSLFGEPPASATSLDVSAANPIFSKVSAGGHPDLLTIERQIDSKKGTQKGTLDVDTARKVAPFLRLTSSNGGWRVVIIDDGDTMNRNAQNAMLKILEEPPKDALLILITHRLGAIIPTIRSRCRVLNFDPLSADALSQLMTIEMGNTLSKSQQDIIMSMAQGSIGQAQEIINAGGLETARQILDLFNDYPKFDWVQIHHLSELCGRAGQDGTFEMVEKTMLWMLENFIFSMASDQNPLPKILNSEKFHTVMQSRSLDQWLALFEILRGHFQQVHYSNLDKRQGVLGAFNLFAI